MQGERGSGGEWSGGTGGNRSEKVEGMGEGKGEFSVAIFRSVNPLDEDTTCTH